MTDFLCFAQKVLKNEIKNTDVKIIDASRSIMENYLENFRDANLLLWPQ